MLLVSKAIIRKIWLNNLREISEFYISDKIHNCIRYDLKVTIDNKDRSVKLKDNIYNKEYTIRLDDLYKYINKNFVVFIDKNGIIEGKLYYLKSIYEIIFEGELDYLNISINGKHIYRKKIPIKDVLETIKNNIDYGKNNNLAILGTRAGYIIDYLEKKHNIEIYEWDKGLIYISKYNPCSKKFIENFLEKNEKIIVDSFRNIVSKISKNSYNTVVYNPPPFYIDTTNFYSKKILSTISQVVNEEGILIVDINKPYNLTITKIFDIIENKIRRYFKIIRRDQSSGLIIAKK